MPKRRATTAVATVLALCCFSALSSATPIAPDVVSLSSVAVTRSTVVSTCDDWVRIYANYWAQFSQCHTGLASTQCCELYDLMDKSIRIFQEALGCVVTNLNIFAEKYSTYCTGENDMDDDGDVAGGPGEPVPDGNPQGGHGDSDGIIILGDGTTQIDNNSGTTGGGTTTTDGGSTTGGGTEGGHGCGSTGCQSNCNQCCYSCCGYQSARALLMSKNVPKMSIPRSSKTHGGGCINCSTGDGCDCTTFTCTSYCTTCGGGTAPPSTQPPSTQPPSTQPPTEHCHQCCYSCCGYKSAKVLLLGENHPVSAVSVLRSGTPCDCNSFVCTSQCTTCSGGGGGCGGCGTSDCSTCPSGCHCSGTGGGSCPSCNNPSGETGSGNSPNPNAGSGNETSNGDDTPVVFDGSTCFAADSTVELHDGRVKRMDEVDVGDLVHVGRGEFSEVFMFTHRSEAHAGEFVTLQTKAGKLSVTRGHFVHSSLGVIAVEMLEVGNAVALADGGFVRVDEISTEIRQGLYNPQTLHGDMVVDGFLATTYTAAVKPGAAQSLLAPLRALYRVCGRRCGAQLGAILFRAAS